ncbi:aminotransferase class IV [Mesorhizobium sp. M00.F.Ca.ET.216.01.1.1]|uniref:aminotransferase class IV n=1 Tax=Mesorhizobium sp. M00.F.Ca.ET.216.01.1.1 TaxID=2500528 RepID=UPI000FDBB260|nr:aminotransferase class IV [Mesorhizobium sp. M00.F.Ca.ET.216.01.1.1]TGQ30408.1 branched-chain amino acid--2-keto-4-methylthiobutyrate aminotransferase [Mesorhizobium sp. M00.F.Ca.ET.216.01.1.1]TJW03700.1 MAG: branched-chain amino acid--2-keto-4-methylthiobutyrate aminotransferase [Mesorhizobium sp.]TJW40221.1 MAG: branched-chain amino acid--2-keto-4-methylthiobutyrate aminotransferase [Mesorhizobium sp.]
MTAPSGLTVGIWPTGAAYINGRYVSVDEAAIPVTDWGYRRSDATYDVVGVWNGAFFRLDDHVRRFRNSMCELRLAPPESDEEIRQVLAECVRLSGLREAYVAVDCLRGKPKLGLARHPVNCSNYLAAFAIPWVWVVSQEVQRRGAHLMIAKTPRISEASIDPTVKNFHWGDLTRGLFEAHDCGADNCILLDTDGLVTEGPGFNVFAIVGGTVVTPDRGALEGITRMSVLELCNELEIPCEVRPMRAAELREADEIFLATTAGGIMPASRIDGRILGNDSPGPLSTLLRETFWTKRAEGWHATQIDYR